MLTMPVSMVKVPPAGRRYARLRVADTGVGMTPEVLAQIFLPFFTTKGPTAGTGLGLATVHGIVTESGGFVTVESRPGQGAAFAVYLPAVDAPAERSAANTPSAGSAQVT